VVYLHHSRRRKRDDTVTGCVLAAAVL